MKPSKFSQQLEKMCIRVSHRDRCSDRSGPIINCYNLRDSEKTSTDGNPAHLVLLLSCLQ